MAIHLGSTQFLYCGQRIIPTDVGYVGHWLPEESIPDEGIISLRSSPSFDGLDYRCPAKEGTLFEGSKKEFLLWYEEFNPVV